MLHLRITVPSARADEVIEHLRATPGVAHLARFPAASLQPAGDLVLCDIAREAAHDVVEWLQRLDVHLAGAITISPIGTVVSTAAELAEAAAPGDGGDALVWEELEGTARREARLTPSLLVLMSLASMIAGIGILLDSPILVVGAMVVGPEYGALAAVCVAAARRRWAHVRTAAATLGAAGLVGVLTVAALSLALRVSGVAPAGYELSDRQLTAFISHPDALTAVVALLAGMAGMLSFTEARASTLVGVLVSVTTIPAVANIGVAAAYREGPEMVGAAAQLAVNVAGLVLAGVATLVVQSHLTTRRHRH